MKQLKRKAININKIISNGLFAFFSALVAANIAGVGFYGIEVALVNGAIMGGMAFALEYKKEAEETEEIIEIPRHVKVKALMNKYVLL